MADLTLEIAESHALAPHQTGYRPVRTPRTLGGPGSGNYGHEGGEGGPGNPGGSSGGSRVRSVVVQADDDDLRAALGKLHLKEADFKRLAKASFKGIPGTWEVTVGVNFYGGSTDRLEFYGLSEEDGWMYRIITADENGKLDVEHHSFKQPEEFQRTGGARAMMRNALEEYPKVGVETITTTAASVGGYVWARAGFSPVNEQALMGKLRARFERQVAGQEKQLPLMTAEEGTRLTALTYESRPLWRIADDPAGRQALLGADYKAKLDLTDPVALRRARHYAGLP